MTTDIGDLYKSFVRSRKALGRSPRTIDGYDLAVRDFSRFLIAESAGTDATLVTRRHVQDFLIEHMSTGHTTTTANKTFRALRSFFNWMWLEDIIEPNPFAKLKAPPARPKPKGGYSIPEVKAIFANLRDDFGSGGRTAYLAIRDYAITMVLYDTGLRAGEILAMTVEGLDPKTQEFEVTGKGNYTYRRHLGVQSFTAINNYLDYWAAFNVEPLSGKLWRGWNGSHFTHSGIYRMCAHRAADVGIKKGDVHRWRYTHAEVLDQLGWPEEVIMAEMGHSQLSVSRHYRKASIARQAIKMHHEKGPSDLLR